MSNKILTNTTGLQEVLELLSSKAAGSGEAPELQDKTVTPTTSVQTVKADSGYDGLDTVTVNAMPTAARANTTITVTADDTNDKLTITASNNQATGYVTGADKTATKTITLSASGASVTASDGTTSISKSVATATHATPSISVNSSGLITASSTQSAGYVAAGTKSATKQLATQAAKTITPSTSSQTAVASGVYTTGAVTVGAIPSTYVKPTATKAATTYTPTTSNQTIASGTYCSGTQTIKGDSNLVAGNIKSGVSIFGVSGSYEGDSSGGIDTSDATATAAEIFEGETAYVDGEKVTGTFTIEDELTTQDSLISQIQTTLNGKAAAGGSINPDDIGTCTVTIDTESTYRTVVTFTALENGTLKPKDIILRDADIGNLSSAVAENILCGSAITIVCSEILLSCETQDITLKYEPGIAGGFSADTHMIFAAPTTPNAIAYISLYEEGEDW
jgi:hypothetical protein